MKIHARWHGGSGYSQGDMDDVELFPSIKAAGHALSDRARHGGWMRQDFNYADGRTTSVYTPRADDSPSMTVWFYDPRDVDDPYPDRLIEIGPRGGINVNLT